MANVFAFGTHTERQIEAQALIAARLREAERIAAELAETDDEFLAEVLSLRLLALRNHVNGWQDYVNLGCPRDERAQITRGYYHRRNLTTTL